MANINLSKTFQSERLEGFGGIGCKTGGGEGGTADMKNFRIDPDGTLKKRTGFSPLLELPEGKLRAIHAVSESTVFALVGNGLYLIDPKLSTCTLKATLTESDSDACFFNYGDALYLIDGTEIYVYSGGEWVAAEGYVPLYGQNWDPSSRGEVYEPMNALSSRIRISYRVRNSSTTSIYIPYGMESLDAVFINGTDMALSGFSWSQSSLSLSVNRTLYVGDIVEVWFAPTVSFFRAMRRRTRAHTRAATYGSGSGGAEPSGLVLYGGENPTEMYISRRVDEESFTYIQQIYADAAPLYVVETDAISINDGNAAITATCRSGPNLAVFTEGSTHLLTKNDDGTPKLLSISQTEGCLQRDGATALENAPVTASSGGILYWEPSVLYDNEYSAKSVSDPVAHLLPSQLSGGCSAYLRPKNEIWFYFGEGGRVWVYNTHLKCWYSFDGFYPELLFTLGSEMAFVNGTTLYTFSDGLYTDDGVPIEATLESPIVTFGEINRKKKLARAMLSFSEGGEVTLTVKDAHGGEIKKLMRDALGERRGYCESRLPCKRSRYYSFSLSHTGGEISIYSLILTAVK